MERIASSASNIVSAGYDKVRSFGGLISPRKEREYAQKQVDDHSIKCVDQHELVSHLSGGNKQKVAFAKWIATDAEILIMDCPTRGVDIGVKSEIYRILYEMKKQGKSILMISEEMSELRGMCDRLLILKDGEVSGEFLRKDGFDEQQIINCMI